MLINCTYSKSQTHRGITKYFKGHNKLLANPWHCVKWEHSVISFFYYTITALDRVALNHWSCTETARVEHGSAICNAVAASNK
jgi:hypothetical protein